MNKTTTIEIYKKDLPKWREWCKKKGTTSCEMMERIMEECRLTHQRELFLSLPLPSNYIKPLFGKKIQKKYRKSYGN